MTDIDTTIDNARKLSVSFNRKVSDGNYGTIEATAWVQGDVPADASPGNVALALGDLFLGAKAAVLDELGIAYQVDDQGVVRELVAPVSVKQAQDAVQRQMGGSESNGDVRVMNPNEASTDPIPDWALKAFARDGVTAVFDNRLTATGKQPLFKEAVARGGRGHGKDGTAKGYWAPDR